jgi:hypothetical protein
MAQYSSGFSVSGVNAANTTLLNLKTAATDRARLVELAVFLAVLPTTTPDLVLARMLAAGTGTVTSTPNASNDPADPSASAVVETGWATTRPTFTTAGPFLRRGGIPLTLGNGLIWQPAKDIIVPVSAGLVLANLASSGTVVGTFSGWITWDE